MLGGKEMKIMNKKNIIVAICLCTCCFIIAPANATLKNSNPNTTCGYLNDLGLNTRGWKHQYDSEYGCSSPYKEFGSGFPLKNNLAYYVDGKANKAEKLKLVLNVNSKNEAKEAHRELLKAATSLVKKAFGLDLPQSITQAIENGTKATTKIGNCSIELIRIDWPTGKGYELKLFIQ
jgi:hypothetical protein